MVIEPGHGELSVVRQCELLGLTRSSYYYEPVPESAENLHYLRLLDEQSLHTPFYGRRRMRAWLQAQGPALNRQRGQRRRRQMGLEGLAPGPRSRRPGPEHQVYPYRLRGLEIRQAGSGLVH
jgi:putative transposase